MPASCGCELEGLRGRVSEEENWRERWALSLPSFSAVVTLVFAAEQSV